MRQAILVSALATLYLSKQVKGAANDNARPYNVLCAILNVATATPDVDTTDYSAKISEELEMVRHLNMSVSDDGFFNQDFKTPNTDRDAKEPWKSNKAAWEKSKNLVEAGETKFHGIKITRKLASHERTVAAAIANETASTIRQLQMKLKSTKTTQDVTAELNKAIYGSTGCLDKEGTSTFVTQSGTGCGGTGEATSKAGISLANDMVCLCSNTNGQNTACTGKAINSDLKYDNSGNAAKAFTKLREKCPMHIKLKATAAGLRNAITSFIGTLKGSAKATQAGNTILGYADADTCNGGANADCVLYKTAEAGKPLNVQWLTHLSTAADILETIKSEQEHNKQLLSSARALVTGVLSSYIQADRPRPDTVSERTINERSTNPSTPPICATHTSKEDCKPPCKWNVNATDKTKKCSLDPKKAAEQQATQAGTGEGAAGAAATGCARHKDNKDKCNKLKSQGCVFDLKAFDGKKCTLSEKGKQTVEKEAEKLEEMIRKQTPHGAIPL
uniref:Variant surface glycoprotein 1125.2564 n=1 Tax=Trypanosoma brucei TaxID=5691 RepID=A0A1J0R896_9TRYP|nr:variant surface glycoprotein 1125.2564 [Trypanosoma brucei]